MANKVRDAVAEVVKEVESLLEGMDDQEKDDFLDTLVDEVDTMLGDLRDEDDPAEPDDDFEDDDDLDGLDDNDDEDDAFQEPTGPDDDA
jgi:hypothetical protein